MQRNDLLLKNSLLLSHPAELQAEHLFLFGQLCPQGLRLFAQPQQLLAAAQDVVFLSQPLDLRRRRIGATCPVSVSVASGTTSPLGLYSALGVLFRRLLFRKASSLPSALTVLVNLPSHVC